MLQNICRTCLESEENEDFFNNMKGTFTETGETIAMIFSRICTVQYDSNDGLPQKICEKCLNELLASYEFQKKCIKSDIKIRKLIGNFSKEKENNIKIMTCDESIIKAEIDDGMYTSDVCDDEKHENICDNLAKPIIETGKSHIKSNSEDMDTEILEINIKPLEIIENSNLDNIQKTTANNVVNKKNGSYKILLASKENINDDNDSDELELPNPKNKRKVIHECEICLKTFDRQNRLQRHMSIHNPEGRPFECGICKSRFASQKTLTRHIIRHTAFENCIKNYKISKVDTCPYCPRKFEKKKSLASHLKVHKSYMNQLEKEEIEIEIDWLSYSDDEKSENIYNNLAEHINNTEEFDNNNIEYIEREPTSPDMVDKNINGNKNLTEIKENTNAEDNIDEIELRDPKNKRNTIHKCEVCCKIFNRKDNLQRHMNVHKPEGRQFECDVCKRRFASQKYLVKHVMSHSAVDDCIKNSEKPKDYRCQYCSRKFAKKESLAAHMRVHKSNIPQSKRKVNNFKCQFCPKSFYLITSLTRHLNIHVDKKDFQCLFCEKTFPIAGKLIEHINWHKTVNLFQCKICTKSFKRSRTLKNHMGTHTGEKQYLCSECGKCFNNSSSLRQHIIRHSGDKPFKCSECPRKFSFSNDLNTHMNIHTKIKSYACNLCESKFTKRSSLKKHNFIHTGERPFECTTCHMKFTCSSHLKRHIYTHTGEKPYSCKYCEKAFVQSNDLVKHLRIHLGDQIYKCSKCNETFRLQVELRDHENEHYRKEKQIKERMDGINKDK